MKLKNVYLTVFILSVISLVAVSTNTTPDVKFFKAFGYNFGINFTEYLWLKIIGFASVSLYVISSFKSAKEVINNGR